MHALHIHDYCCVCIRTLAAIFALSLVDTVYLHGRICLVLICCAFGCRNISEDVQQACKLLCVIYHFVFIYLRDSSGLYNSVLLDHIPC